MPEPPIFKHYVRLLIILDLEISRPRRPTRPAPVPPRASPPCRSRSPELGRAPTLPTARVTGDLYDQPYESSQLPPNGFCHGFFHCRCGDRRSPRSRTPRLCRARYEHRSRDRSTARFERRRRPRSPRSPRVPYSRDRRSRSLSPRAFCIDEGETYLPIPRRAPRDVPDVQLVVLEELDRLVDAYGSKPLELITNLIQRLCFLCRRCLPQPWPTSRCTCSRPRNFPWRSSPSPVH